MKLGQLIDTQALKNELFGLASTPWVDLDPAKRVKQTKSYIIRHRLGEKVAKFIASGQHKQFCVGEMPKPRTSSEWVCAHAQALAGEQSFKPMKAVKLSLEQIFMFYGCPENRTAELSTAFDNFQIN